MKRLIIYVIMACYAFSGLCQGTGNETIKGYIKPGFEPVMDAFIKNFNDGKELGAALCVYFKGEKVVDIWGGYSDKKKKQAWDEHTMVLFFSATKGIASLCMAKLYSEGKIDYNERVATYWPGFAKNGKENITVSQLLSHQSGLCLWDGKLTVEQVASRGLLIEKLENAYPMWIPGEHSGYSAGLAGFYMSELLRRVDDEKRSMGQYFQEEFAQPLALKFYIGLPDTIPSDRIAYMQLLHPVKRILTLGKLPKDLRKTVSKPNSLFMKSITQIKGYNVNNRSTWRIEDPSGNGIGTARSVAFLYGMFAHNYRQTGISNTTMDEISASALIPKNGTTDKVMGIPLYYRNGFMKNGEGSAPFPNNSCFGFGGASGSMAFADPINQLGYCYVPNKQGPEFPDRRELSIQKVLYECIENFTNPTNDNPE